MFEIELKQFIANAFRIFDTKWCVSGTDVCVVWYGVGLGVHGNENAALSCAIGGGDKINTTYPIVIYNSYPSIYICTLIHIYMYLLKRCM